MRMSNLTMFAVALICAAAAALLSRAWLVGQSSQAPTQEQAVPAPTRAIIVAARDLSPGDKLSADALRLVPWSAEAMPKGAFTDKEALLIAGKDRRVISPIAENEPVLESRLLGAGSVSALAAKLSDSMTAVTIRVNDVAGVAGLVQPDDHVDVFMTYGDKVNNEASQSVPPSVAVLLRNVRVLALDQSTERKDNPSPAKAVTLEVNTQDAQKLVLASSIGSLSLALKRFENTGVDDPGKVIAMDDLISAEDRLQAGNATPAGPVVGVTRSVERSEYRVLQDDRRDESFQHETLSHR